LELKEALTIAGLGISVVFLGLIFTSIFIFLISYFSKQEKRAKKTKLKKAKIDIDISPDIVAVISTVIEIEVRLLYSLRDTKFTFNKDKPKGWTKEGKFLGKTYEGGSKK